MTRQIDDGSPGIRIVRHDPDGALSWMSAICGPHWLKVGAPKRLQFQHSGNVLRGMSTTLGVIEYGTDVTVGIDAANPLNCYSISLPVSGQQELALAGSRLVSDRDTGVIVSPDSNQELTIAGNCRKMQVAITRQAMAQVLAELLRRPPVQPLVFAPDMSSVTGGQASWWRMVQHIIGEMEQAGGGLYGNSDLSGDLEKALIKGLILSQKNNYSDELLQDIRAKQPHYLIRAKEFIHTHARDEIDLEDIEAAAGIPRYKLFEVFKEHLGMSPMAYLKKFRLDEVRRVLSADRSGSNVSSVALDYGFSHLGRFSIEYRKAFGESPSQTVKRQLAKFGS